MIEASFRLQRGVFVLDAQFSVPAQGVTAVFGPSGMGKTTLLRCIAGLERAAGFFKLRGDYWQNDAELLFLPTHKRPVGYVFQDVALFPHLSVQKNLLYGYRRIASSERQVRFDDAVALLGIEPLLARKPNKLSGVSNNALPLPGPCWPAQNCY